MHGEASAHDKDELGNVAEAQSTFYDLIAAQTTHNFPPLPFPRDARFNILKWMWDERKST